ncbi:MAG: hypothetical protein JXN60_07910 [Lentisphaerae bacterium]|nr:hypothetical protein [Lentisphaerota bacterium]
MNTLKKMTKLAVVVIITGTAIITGCEEDKSRTDLDKFFDEHPYISDPRENADQSLVMDPESAQVTFVGKQVTFYCSGGTPPYQWTVVNSARGTITSATGTQTPSPAGIYSAVYKTTIVADNTVVAYDQNHNAAIADIVGVPPTFTITPSTDTILVPTNDLGAVVPAGVTVNLRATGGAQPYGTWMSSADSIGTVAAIDNSSAVFTYSTSGAYGSCLVSLTDADGKIVTAEMIISIITE